MKFTEGNKQAFNTVLPLAAMGLAYYFGSKGKKSQNEILVLVAVVGLLSWICARSISKQLIALSEAPEHVNVDPDAAGTIDEDFDPTQLTNKLKDDIYGWGFRDGDLYAELAALSNANLMKVYNDWTDRYYSEDNETMVEAMEGENYGITSSYTYNAENIINRLKGMGAN